MRTPTGRELAERLIAKSSVVSENFAPGVMERWGLTYERLEELSPDVIYARMSGYGHSGPHAEYRSYGPVVQAVSGLSYISGLPGREPSGWGLSYMDNQAAYYNSTALLMAIYRRNRTGQGTEIDVSAIEAGINLVGPVLLDVTVNGRTTRRPDFPTGNRLEWPHAAPHGVYPAVGEDRWVAIAVFDDAQWSGLVEALERPRVDRATRASPPRRNASRNQDALDEHLAAWTRERDRHEVMELLQATRRAGRGRAERPGPQRARPAGRPPRRVLRDGPPGDRRGSIRGQRRSSSRRLDQDNWRSGSAAGRGQRVRVQADRRRAPTTSTTSCRRRA